MKNNPAVILTALLFLSPAATVRSDIFPPPVLPESAGVQLKSGNTSDANLAEISQLGFKYVRRGFIWSAIEKTPGQYDFSAYDRLVDDAGKHGLHILGCLALNNKLYPGVKEPAGREAFARFAAKVAEHYKGRPVIWELWNEPNNAGMWGRHGKANCDAFADEYSAFVKTVAPAMHQANPDALVVAGSVNLYEASFNWMERCFKNGVLQAGINGWSVHPYSTKSPEGHLAYYTRIRKLFAENGASAGFPLLNSERGYPIGKAEGYAGGDPALSREYQAWHFVRQYLCDRLAGIKLTIWYEWSGREGFSLKTPGEPNPAMNAARVMIDQLKGYAFDQRLPLASPQDYVLRFTNAAGGVKLAAWTSPPSGQSPDKTVEHDVVVPVAAAGPLAACDLYGHESRIPVTNGSLTLRLGGATQYITVNPSR